MQGTVILDAIIGVNGNVTNLEIVLSVPKRRRSHFAAFSSLSDTTLDNFEHRYSLLLERSATMRVTFLGTGNAFASGARNAMAILLQGDDLGVLLDCGPTTLVALKKLGLSPADVDVILLSHHHGDHFGGVPFLALHECYQGSREKPLRILGPEGTETKVTQSVSLFFPGIEAPFSLEYRDLAPSEPFTLGTLRATPFEVDHYSRGVAFGYRVVLSGKTVVFSGDTAWTDELVGQSSDADLFVCECSSFGEPIGKHMSHRDLENNRSRLTAKQTLLVHAGDDVLAHEPELVFELAHDGMEVTL